MPAFEAIVPSSKRKHEDEEPSSRKRTLLGSPTLESNMQQDKVWVVQWRNPQFKKHKTWEGDGVLVINALDAILYDSDGKSMGVGKIMHPLYEGKSFSIASKEVELERTIPREQFLSGLCFGQKSFATDSASSTLRNNPMKKFNCPTFKAHPSSNTESHSLAGNTSRGSQNSGIQENKLIEVTNHSQHWAANWRKPQEKKNKTWDGDAYVSLVKNKLLMISEEGKIMGTTPWKGDPLHSGFKLFIGGKEVELDAPVTSSQLPDTKGAEPGLLVDRVGDDAIGGDDPPKTEMPQRFITPANFYGIVKTKAKGPLHDPSAPDMLVMKHPTKEHMKKYNKRGLAVIPVVVDPILSRKMRVHQKEGVKFLYECVMGLRKHEGQGCILADEMGLGKTLQTICLVWTLLRQNPYAAPVAVVQKVLIVCPVSLVNNWKSEFHKWLGRDRLGIMALDKNSSSIDLFGRSKVYEVLIIGYERLRTVIDKLADIQPPIGLIICDEGHRLKSANNKTAAMFKTLDTRRRIILSGTPIQNALGEFHAMAEFCNPGLLDDYSVFRKVYETPILKSRTPDASSKEIELGETRTAQLLKVAKSFVLRRDATLLKNHLPPKSEYVVFVSPTSLQLNMFSAILHPKQLDDLMQSSTAESLALINILTKISNSPILLKATADSIKGKKKDDGQSIQRRAVADALELLPEKTHVADMNLSGKLIVLSKMLKVLRQNTGEKCVLVSHYTSTLNILEAYCKKSSYSYYRLDGQTPQNKRQEYVNAFNGENQRSSFVFLLSSKAGGVGINLIGASRLFIVDSDWNPSHDLQSMARCHRDGQKRPVFIYRLLTAGAIDEKIYQRQVTKLALSDSLIGTGGNSSKSDSFTRKDLRDIFRIHTDTACNTHDLLECPCDGSTAAMNSQPDPVGTVDDDPEMKSGFINASNVRPNDLDAQDKAYLQKKKAGLAALSEWKHINCLEFSTGEYIQDDVLRNIAGQNVEINDSSYSGLEKDGSRLDRTDVDTQSMNNSQSVHNVPSGIISFLFEKSSKANLDDVVDE
ncbi:hypothetical protein M413DRAFT_441835 [Hebeloma cylindrosporum]|uniref:DNA repair and recombination protein RAD54B n=1 Tax=Hebeloma cylindrosporum TaxID=76867 RepID=A0A0C2YW10_HEBCY|nr:hypothetical protein M413DRAFT_441835 [Hebeloma cylindrosporum h7]